jgi:anti-sigma factor RsiW
MTDCSDILALLSAFHDGELEPSEMLHVARHVAKCRECDAVVAAYGVVGNEMRESIFVQAPEWFAASVMARVERMRPSIGARVARYLSSFNDRIGAGLSLATAAAAVAAVTAIILTPYVHQIVAPRGQMIVASAQPAAINLSSSARAISQNNVSSAAPARNDARTVISRLEAENPAVAVWSEPRTDTTVIWLPDRQH